MSEDVSENFDDTQIIKNLDEVKRDITKLLKDLEYTYNLNPNNQDLHELKMKSVLFNLESIDSKLFNAYNLLKLENEDDLASNFGISVKLDMAKEKLNVLKEKHKNLNKEWHSQDEHISKICEKICKKEEELKTQSLLCTVQGLTLGKILWKMSKNSKLLEKIVLNEKLAIDLIKIYSGCLYGFIRAFENHIPDPITDEYQFVLCLTGIFNNFATIPDGRFFLLHQSVCRDVIDQVIKTIPFISIPNGEDLKFLTLSTIYNIMICEEGKQFMKNNCCLMRTLKSCIDPLYSDRIAILALKIMNNLLQANNRTFEKLDCPIKQLKVLQTNSLCPSVRKHAKEVLTFLQSTNKNTSTETSDVLKIKPKQLKMWKESCTGTETNLTCCFVTDTNVSTAFSSIDETAVSRSSRSTSEYSSSTSSLTMTSIKSEPTSLQKHTTTSIPSNTCTVDNDISWSREKSVSCNTSQQSENNEKLMLLENFNSIASEEIQNIQYQLPYTNIESKISITIGDNVQNLGNMNARLSLRDGLHTEGDDINTSTVTVYRMNNSRMFAVSDNSLFPFIHLPQNNFQSPIPNIDVSLKTTQELTNIIDQVVKDTPTTSKQVSDYRLNQKCIFLSDMSVNEELEVTKITKKQSKKRHSKKKRNTKCEFPVFKIPHRTRKRV